MFFFFLPFLFLFRIGEEKKQTCEETWKLSSRRRRKNAHNFCMYKRKHRSPERLNLKKQEWIKIIDQVKKKIQKRKPLDTCITIEW
jgi:hypothetical protein